MIDDGRAMVPRINKILQKALDSVVASTPESEFEDVTADPFTAPKVSANEELREVPSSKE